jgi:hypothetical protein
MKIKKELQAVCAAFGEKPGGYQSTWEDAQALAVVHSVGAVVRDFTEWMEENQGDDFSYGPVSKYLQVASARLSSGVSPVSAVLKDPEVVSLVRELSYASGGQICFVDKQRARLAEVLKEFTAEEIKSAFKTWVETQDLNDPKNLSFLPGKFVQIVDNLAYSARKQKQEAEKAKTLRDATALRLQEEAEIDRQAREKMKQDESEIFDPLAELLSETDQTVV